MSAPAGFGKTTLLTAVAGRRPRRTPRVAWLSLDRRDNDPALFWTYVIDRAADALPTARRPARCAAAVVPPPTEAALAALLNDLDALPERPACWSWTTTTSSRRREMHDGMAFLLEHLPPQLHLVIATRADPPLPLAALRARGQLVELRAADLRFTAEESAGVPQRVDGTRADRAATSRRWTARTEGWIAALQLAALSMQGRDDVSAFIAGFAGDDRYVVDYLVEEVLARQPADVRDFLLRTVDPRPADRSALRRGHRTGPAAGPRSWRSSAPTSSSSRSTTGGTGTATTTCSPTCCTRTCSTSTPDEVRRAAPAGQRLVRGRRRHVAGDQPRAGRR